MSENSAIEWTDHTFNPWMGCTKVGPGCDHCYAETLMDTRYGKVHWGVGQPRLRTTPANWRKPLAWQRNAAAFFAENGRRQRVFCASLADVFDNAVDTRWRMDLFELIAKTPDLDWQLLTKRIGNVMPMCSGDSLMFDLICERVWLGATVVNQEEFDRDYPKLLAVPARVRFLSCEPLLGPISFDGWPIFGEGEDYLLHWVIAGGESGPGARPMHPAWARRLRDECATAGVPFLFKQWGEWAPWEPKHPVAGVRHLSARDGAWGSSPGTVAFDGPVDGYETRIDTRPMAKVGKKAAGRLLDGVEHNGFAA